MAVDEFTFVAAPPGPRARRRARQEVEFTPASAGIGSEVFMLGDWVVTVTYSEAIDLPEGLSLEAYIGELDAAADRLAGRVDRFETLDALFADLDGEE